MWDPVAAQTSIPGLCQVGAGRWVPRAGPLGAAQSSKLVSRRKQEPSLNLR